MPQPSSSCTGSARSRRYHSTPRKRLACKLPQASSAASAQRTQSVASDAMYTPCHCAHILSSSRVKVSTVASSSEGSACPMPDSCSHKCPHKRLRKAGMWLGLVRCSTRWQCLLRPSPIRMTQATRMTTIDILERARTTCMHTQAHATARQCTRMPARKQTRTPACVRTHTSTEVHACACTRTANAHLLLGRGRVSTRAMRSSAALDAQHCGA
jgi:hypothetical protein